MAKNSPKTLVLLDAHAIIHRAYHALPEFFSSSGEPTGALYGLSTMLMKIITELKPDYIVAAYDLPGKTFRHEAYDGYKGKRAKADDALKVQLGNSRKIFEAFSIPIYDAPGFEADDVLGTIVEKLKNEKNINIIIASGDMDTMQLVDDKKVQVYTLRKGIADTILYDEGKVVERYGMKPAFLPDFKGLRGDPSDNIVGVKGIGEKTATTLITKFGTIEAIYKKLKSKGHEYEFKEAGISDRVLTLLKENEEEALFSKTLAKIRRDAPVDFKIPEQTFWEAANPDKMAAVFADFEFRSLVARLKTFFNNGEKPEAIAPLPPRIETGDEEKLNETKIALSLINSDITNPTLEDVLFFAKTKDFPSAHQTVFKTLKERGLEKVFEEIERPIMGAVQRMGEYGILVDQKYFQDLSDEYHKELNILTKRIYKMAGVEFNLNSPKQLAEVLFGKMKLASRGKTGGGARSTKISVLEELEEDHAIVREIMAYRELQKLLSTYIDVIPARVAPDGRLHAKFLQNGATTGRFSSQNPNLQNLPIKSELGRRIRHGFIAPEGSKLLALDYSQIELRVAAILSRDPKLTQIFEDGKDAHAGVASFVFGVPQERVTSEMRRQAKVINFGIIYGMGVTALRKNLGGSREEAQKFYDNYFRQFSGLNDYLEEVKAFATKNFYTETLFGRRRYFPNINSKIPFLRAMALRTATNAPLQGTAADIIKLAIRFAEEDLKKAGLDAQAVLVLQVHDELVFEVRDDVLPKAEKIIRGAMESVLQRSFLGLKTKVPLVVQTGAGQNLGEVK